MNPGHQKTRRRVAVLLLAGCFCGFSVLAGSAQQKPTSPSAVSNCIDAWRTTRGISSDQLSTQTAESLIRILSRTEPDILTDGCEGINVVLDKVRSDASSPTSAEVTFGTGENASKVQADFKQAGNLLSFSGDEFTLSGTSGSNVFKGTYNVDNKARTLQISNVTYEAAPLAEPGPLQKGTTAALVIRGIVSKAPSPLIKSEPVTIRLLPHSGPSLNVYILYHLPATGEQYCGGPNCEGYADEVFRKLIEWSHFFAQPVGFLDFDFTAPPVLTIFLDGEPVPEFEREAAVAANRDHVVRAMDGSKVYWSATLQVQSNGVRHCPGTGTP
ncbi:MAG: hypothetical protein ACLGSD_00330 [Acidobacteriota bacterium]